MAENKMKEVAKLLGVELEEEFRLNGYKLKYKLSNNGLMYWSNTLQHWALSSIIGGLLTGEKKIIKIPKPILDEKEKEYLGSVIKPFRDMVISVRKYHYDKYYEYITIIYYDVSKYLSIYLPPFKKGTMYKCMELDREYTLEELGI